MPRKSPERVIVITGASNGPGRAIALQFALHGDALALGSRREGPLDIVRRDCEALHALTIAQVTDPADQQSAFALANAAFARFRRVDVWVNYAPPFSSQRGETPSSAFDGTSEYDPTGYEHGAEAALACFKALGGGVLVNVDSFIGGAPPGAEDAHHNARMLVRETFAGIEKRARAMEGVHVLSIAPPRTPLASQALAPRVVSLALAHTRGGIAGRLHSAFERARFELWSHTVRTGKRGTRSDAYDLSSQPDDAPTWVRDSEFEEQSRRRSAG